MCAVKQKYPMIEGNTEPLNGFFLITFLLNLCFQTRAEQYNKGLQSPVIGNLQTRQLVPACDWKGYLKIPAAG